MTKKNGKIELMRFLFSIGVVLFHVNTGFWEEKMVIRENMTFFLHGYIAVEFFFVVSGFLMARSVSGQVQREGLNPDCRSGSLGDDTLRFLWRKVKGFLPYHLIFSAMALVVYLLWRPANLLQSLILKLPGLFFLQRTGLPGAESIVVVEWYLSSMLLAMAILYPLCKRYGRTFSRLAAPLCGFLILGYLGQTVGGLSGTSTWNVFTYNCNLRAVSELCLGIACYEVCQAIKDVPFSGWQRALCSLIEGGGYLVALCYTCSDAESKYDFYILLLLCVTITLTFSRKGLLGESRLFDNRFCYLLGGVSLPIYMCHAVMKLVVTHWFAGLYVWHRVALMLILSLAVSFAVYFLWNAVVRFRAAHSGGNGASVRK